MNEYTHRVSDYCSWNGDLGTALVSMEYLSVKTTTCWFSFHVTKSVWIWLFHLTRALMLRLCKSSSSDEFVRKHHRALRICGNRPQPGTFPVRSWASNSPSSLCFTSIAFKRDFLIIDGPTNMVIVWAVSIVLMFAVFRLLVLLVWLFQLFSVEILLQHGLSNQCVLSLRVSFSMPW